ncbi:hypothetical protein [Belnapia sp. F-4-1]|uniref:hypothetical protein n=1 Tax=Belnapia sp. F-4-1 TaxID=1545443 RepID=UPI0005BBA093|nr:hypothetical protein [Belnapia sp. F-4-1]
MRHAIFGLALATLPLAFLPAAAQQATPQPRPAAATAEPDIGLPHPPLVECRPLYAPAPLAIGPASVNQEQATEGLVLIGTACTPAG